MSKNTLAAIVLSLCAALPAAAQSSNFSAWSALGDVVAGPLSATLSTAATASGETPPGGGDALLWYELETALGTTFDADTVEGSALSTGFSAAAGTRIELNWTLSSSDSDPAFADRAYVVVDGLALTLAQVGMGAGSGVYSHSFTTGGAHTLAFALLDVNDSTGVSTLTLDGLQVTAVPEPATLALMLAGVAGVAAAVRRGQGAR